MKFMSELWRWAWSMRRPLMVAFAGKRGLHLYMNLVLRWRRWHNRNSNRPSYWNITREKFRNTDQDGFAQAFGDALAKRLGVEMRDQMRAKIRDELVKCKGVHIALGCEHCGERVSADRHEFRCPHCDRLCEANMIAAGMLMQMTEGIQAMTPAELDAMLRKGESDADQD